ncbi:MAG: hypothetical protein IT380_22555 [Myxococcales bacterium]|nr:hypothetical protein [Myxococcales bacterium]
MHGRTLSQSPPAGNHLYTSGNPCPWCRDSSHSRHLDGSLLNQRGHVQSEKVERTCRPVVIDLVYDGASGHLVGTRDGFPLRLAPLVFRRADGEVNPCLRPEGPP